MSTPPFVLVLGGARSGKSRYAEALAARSGRPVTYVATAGPPCDAEMAARVAAHRARRPAGWTTVEEPAALANCLGADANVTIVDCLTLWLSNRMLADANLAVERERLIEAFVARRGPVVAVSNEVGQGIVPATALGRAFRDEQGVLNQRAACVATHVVLMVAGLPLVVKPTPQPELML